MLFTAYLSSTADLIKKKDASRLVSQVDQAQHALAFEYFAISKTKTNADFSQNSPAARALNYIYFDADE